MVDIYVKCDADISQEDCLLYLENLVNGEYKIRFRYLLGLFSFTFVRGNSEASSFRLVPSSVQEEIRGSVEKTEEGLAVRLRTFPSLVLLLLFAVVFLCLFTWPRGFDSMTIAMYSFVLVVVGHRIYTAVRIKRIIGEMLNEMAKNADILRRAK